MLWTSISIETESKYTCSISDQLRYTPVLETTVWKISAYNERDFALRQLFYGDLERISLAIQRDQYWSVHTKWMVYE